MSEIKGNCPMGCGDTLFIGAGGYITCSWHKCPNPAAACDLLLDHATPHHIVHLHEFDFDILHPLRERLNGELFECPLHKELGSLHGPPRKPGRYIVSDAGDGRWAWRDSTPPTVAGVVANTSTEVEP